MLLSGMRGLMCHASHRSSAPRSHPCKSLAGLNSISRRHHNNAKGAPGSLLEPGSWGGLFHTQRVSIMTNITRRTCTDGIQLVIQGNPTTPTDQNKTFWEYTMRQAQRSLCRAHVLSCIAIGYASLGFGQTSDAKSSAIIERIMTTALSRCYSTVSGVKRITFEPATNQEFAEVEGLGQKAVAPLARYLDLQPKNGFTRLFAVKFLMAIGGLPR